MRHVKGIYVGDHEVDHPDSGKVTLNVWMNPETRKLVGVVNMDVDADKNCINDPYKDGVRLVFANTFSGLPA
jgi:hypothetical protein